MEKMEKIYVIDRASAVGLPDGATVLKAASPFLLQKEKTLDKALTQALHLLLNEQAADIQNHISFFSFLLLLSWF